MSYALVPTVYNKKQYDNEIGTDDHMNTYKSDSKICVLFR